MRIYKYPANFTPAEEGGFVITFADLPEAITQAETITEGFEEAADALDEAIIGRINRNEEIPVASPTRSEQYAIPVPALTAIKTALYEEIKEQNLSKVELAALLGIDEKEVRRLLDPHHASKLSRIAEILERAGKHIIIQVGDEEDLYAQPV